MILDPTNIIDAISIHDMTPEDQRIFSPIVHSRAFPYFPDVRQLRAGDLILTAPAKIPTYADKVITRFQEKRLEYGDPVWTHAAIYLYDNMIVEARPFFKNTQQNVINRFVPDRKIFVRRPAVLASLEPQDATVLGYRMALQAALYIGKSKYGYTTLIRNLMSRPIRTAITAFSHEGRVKRNPSFVCSELYNRASKPVLRHPLVEEHFERVGGFVTPSLLAVIETLIDVEVGWVDTRRRPGEI